MSLKRNVLANYLGQAYGMALNIVMVPVYIRYLGAEAYGLVGFFGLLQVWFQLLDFGLSQTLTREVARFCGGAHDGMALHTLVRTMEVVFLALAGISAATIFLLAPWLAAHWLKVEHLEPAGVAAAIRLMAGIVALRLVVAPHRSLLMGLEHQVLLNVFLVVTASCRFLGVLLAFWWLEPTPLVFFNYQLGLAVVETVILVGLARRALPVLPPGTDIRPALNCLQGNVGFASAIAFTSSIWIIVTYVDRLILSSLLPLSEYAYYTAGVAMANAVNLVTAPASTALLPRLTRLVAEQQHGAAIGLYRQFTRWVCAIAFPVAAVLFFFPHLALWVWTGNSALADFSARPLGLYALGNAILAVGAFPYYLQYAKGDVLWHLYGNIIFALVFVPLLALTAYRYGPVGAAAAWLAVNFLYVLAWIPLVHRRVAPGLHASWLVRDVLRPAVFIFGLGWILSLLLPVADSRAGGAFQLGLAGLGTLVVALLTLWLGPRLSPDEPTGIISP